MDGISGKENTRGGPDLEQRGDGFIEVRMADSSGEGAW